MNRFIIMTVGKTHSGKTTFAKLLEKHLMNSVVIDQDHHAEFLHKHYKKLLPQQGPNAIKYDLTQMIVNYAVTNSHCHLILCNSNRNQKGRLQLLEQYHKKGFQSILVHFEIADEVLKERVKNSQRSTTILRTASNFEEVLNRQELETNKGDIIPPHEGEASHLFTINDSNEISAVIETIVSIISVNNRGEIISN